MSQIISIAATVINADGEETELKTTSYDLYRAEKELGGLTLFEGKTSIGELYALVWSAARRAGIAGDDFDAWLQEVEIAIEADEDPKD